MRLVGGAVGGGGGGGWTPPAGTEGYTLYYDSGSADWIANANVFYDAASTNLYLANGIGLGGWSGALYGIVSATKATGEVKVALEHTGDNTANRNLALSFYHSNGNGASIYAQRQSGNDNGMILIFNVQPTSGGAVGEAMRITEGGLVGINKAYNPDGLVHITDGSAGAVTANADADSLIIEGNLSTGISILTPDSSYSRLVLGSPSSNEGGELHWIFSSRELSLNTNVGSGYIRFATDNDLEAMRITSARRVGIGVTNPDGPLHVLSGTAGVAAPHTSADEITIESSGDGGLTILTPDASTSYLAFGGPADSIGAYMSWNQSILQCNVGTHYTGGELLLKYGNGAEGARLNASGFFGVGTSTPDGTIHAHTDTAGTVTAAGGADDLVVENSSNGGISILVPNASIGTLAFGTPADAYGAYLNWDYTNALYSIGTNATNAEVSLTSGTSSTEAIRIDSSQQVGVGISAPDGTLHVHTATAGTVTANSYGSDLVVENNTYAGISILAPDTSVSSLIFGSPSDDYGAVVNWNYSGLNMVVGTNATGGSVKIQTGFGFTAINVASDQKVCFGSATPTAKLDVDSDVIRLRTSKTPSSASDTGNAGDHCWDSSYFYICIAANTWQRVAHATW